MRVSENVKFRDDSENEAEVEIVVDSRDGEQAVAWVRDIEAAVEDALPEEWY